MPLEVKRFTLGNYYHMGCTDKKREYIKDCTAEGARLWKSQVQKEWQGGSERFWIG